MPYAMFESLIAQVKDPRTFLLNYSGESTVYPDLIPAIRLARSTGAAVELVTALVCAAESLLADLSRSGLSRLTVSVHATDPEQYPAIYRYGSYDGLRTRLLRFIELCRETQGAPVTDLAFVAMDRNLTELAGVADLAQSLALRDIFIFPVIRRDEIPVQFPGELTMAGSHRPHFQERLASTLEHARGQHPDIAFTICNPLFTPHGRSLGEIPIPYPEPLPSGAHIHSCEQNPWETAHVLSNGDVVACEVLDKLPLGNLARQTLDEIWHGDGYNEFRQRYERGEVPECRACPWKIAYRPAPLRSDIVALHGHSPQLLHGWHNACGEPHIWSTQQAQAVIAPRTNSRSLHLNGMLPPGPGESNALNVHCNGQPIGSVENRHEDILTFGVDFHVPHEPPWLLDFRTTHVYRPSERGTGTDRRDLGFALSFVTSTCIVQAAVKARRRTALRGLERLIKIADVAGGALPKFKAPVPADTSPGVSVIVPERDSPVSLSACLASIRAAALNFAEPIEIIVVVNGSGASAYKALQRANPCVQWQFHPQPLGFGEAIGKGLECARFDWVYLLNNDAVLDPNALRSSALCRARDIFSIGSQIVLNDATRYRDETNWTTLLIYDGLATTHDRIPESDAVAGSFYSGGGASLFQTRLLRSVLDVAAYRFYWEDVEWGWRARKLGYRSVFCPTSIAHHERQATVRRCYSEPEIEAMRLRGQLLFQLRNLTTAGSIERVWDEIAAAPDAVADYFVHGAARWPIVRGRLWNHRAPVANRALFAQLPHG